jgi:uridine kinase
MIDVGELCSNITSMHSKTPAEVALLVGVSGIDGSGKGYVTAKLADELVKSALRPAVVNADAWLNLPSVRFNAQDSGRHFYQNAFRFEEMFDQLILPLRRSRSVDVMSNLVEENSTKYHRSRYVFDDIDVILLEGIFLFKKSTVGLFDLRIWIECPFDIALDRAVRRSQEGLSARETINAYQDIYFPAQRIHAEADNPRAAAHLCLNNDRDD